MRLEAENNPTMVKPGSIIRIRVTNFLTFSNVELSPGQNFNLVLGPNGSGKSSIVAAIILGLGGSPKIIGRGERVSEYVKHGKDVAIIDILLQGEGDDDQIQVQRSFNRNDQSTWKLNGSKRSQKEVLDFLRKFNVQVDNLCQCLPQDRVSDFAKMNAQELLQQTQIALCRQDLVQQQQQLIHLTEKKANLVSSLERLDKKIEDMKAQNLRLEGRVKNFQKRKEYLADFDALKRKEFWVKYSEAKSRVDSLAQELGECKDDLKRRRDAIKPFETHIRKIEQEWEKTEQENSRIVKRLKSLEAIVSTGNEQVAAQRSSITALLADRDAQLLEIEQRDSEIAECKRRIVQLDVDKKEIEKNVQAEGGLDNKIQELNESIREESKRTYVLQDRRRDAEGAKRERKYKIDTLQQERQRIENVKEQRFELLRRLDPDAHAGTLWLRENKHLFEAEVFEPILLEVDVIDPKFAKYVENSIGFRDKIAFMCTSTADMNLLIRHLRIERQLAINVVHGGGGADEDPDACRRPRRPIEHLKRFGFHSYVLSLFTAPDPIKNYLCRTYRLHEVPVADKAIDIENIPKDVNSYYLGNFKVSVTYSRYSGEKIVREDECGSDGTLSISLDRVRLATIAAETERLERQQEEQDQEIKTIDQSCREADDRIESCRAKMQEIRQSRQRIEVVESKKRIVVKKLTDLQEGQVQTKDDIDQSHNNKMQVLIKKMLKKMKAVQISYGNYCRTLQDHNLCQTRLDEYNLEAAESREKSQDLKRHVVEAEQRLKSVLDDHNETKIEAKTAHEKAKELSEGFDIADKGFDKFRREFERLPEDLEELASERELLNSKIDCLVNAADEAELENFGKRIKDIESCENKVQQEKRELEHSSEEIERKKEEWLEGLKQIVGRINDNFSAAFDSMGCSGEVDVSTGDNENDFDKYGISIKVTFRSGEPLQELNTVTQSGGERAVATATYMLALQEMTPVPFRCVDEINQGMDVHNERRMFELLVDATSKSQSSQFFLITPKLIPNLKYTDSMKIHFVHNGPFVCEQNAWN